MAELPDINEQIGKDQIANETDNRQRLQKSLRAGLLNVVKSVDGMHNTLRDLYEMQKAGWDAQAMQAGLDLEAAREASRGGGLGGGGDGDVTVNGDVTLDAGKNKGLFGVISPASPFTVAEYGPQAIAFAASSISSLSGGLLLYAFINKLLDP